MLLIDNTHISMFKSKKIIIAITGISLIVSLSACGKKNEAEKPVVTQINELLANSEHPCKASLLGVGADLILEKEHFLTLANAPKTVDNRTEAEDTADKEKDVELTNQTINNTQLPLVASGLLAYKDRPAHVRFQATQIDQSNQDSKCLVSYQLDYHFDEPCMSIREDAFKKWNQLSSVNNAQGQTRYFQHMRKPDKKAFLTDLARNTQCLVRVQESKLFSVDTK